MNNCTFWRSNVDTTEVSITIKLEEQVLWRFCMRLSLRSATLCTWYTRCMNVCTNSWDRRLLPVPGLPMRPNTKTWFRWLASDITCNIWFKARCCPMIEAFNLLFRRSYAKYSCEKKEKRLKKSCWGLEDVIFHMWFTSLCSWQILQWGKKAMQMKIWKITKTVKPNFDAKTIGQLFSTTCSDKGCLQASQTVWWSSESVVVKHTLVHFKSFVVTLLTPLSSSSIVFEKLVGQISVLFRIKDLEKLQRAFSNGQKTPVMEYVYF